jgi:hypothetical protein
MATIIVEFELAPQSRVLALFRVSQVARRLILVACDVLQHRQAGQTEWSRRHELYGSAETGIS